MGTFSSQVGKRKFQGLETGSSLPWQPWVPTLGTISSNLYEMEVLRNGNLWFPGWEPGVPTSGSRQILAIVTFASHVGNHQFEALGTRSSLQS